MSFLRDILSENNGTSYCLFRVAGAALAGSSIPTLITGAVFDLVKNGHIDYVEFCKAVSILFGGLTLLAGGVAVKAKTETP